MKPGKYVGKTFTPDQVRARAMSRKALKMRVTLAEALGTYPDRYDREQWHKRLDLCLDRIDRLNAGAVALFPDVEESFTIASMTFEI